jgi:ATP-binding cassette subfamily B protein
MRRTARWWKGWCRTFVESLQGIAGDQGVRPRSGGSPRFEAANHAVLAQQQVIIFWRVSLFSPAIGLLTRVNMMVLLGYGGWLVIHGQLPLGTGLIVFAGLLEQFSGQVNNVATIVNSVQQSLIGARRVFEILDAPIEVKNAPDAVAGRGSRARCDLRTSRLPTTARAAVVRDIDLTVKPGQCVAILGATGAGKSVLMSLMPRFFDPTAGRVLIDGDRCPPARSRRPAPQHRPRLPGELPLLEHRRGEHRLRPPRRDAGAD